jgi:predicted enzyme related to lactoylglutathione lyase
MIRRAATVMLSLGTLLAFLLVASQLQYNALLAQVPGGAGNSALRGLVLLNVPADDVQKAVQLYSGLLGIEFARSLSEEESYHAPLNDEGTLLTISKRNAPGDPITPFFAVDDLAQALQQFNAGGARTIVPPFDLAIPGGIYPDFRKGVEARAGGQQVEQSLGRAAEVVDTAGNKIGVIQLAGYAKQVFFKTTGPGAERRKQHDESIAIGKKFRP